MVTLMVILTTLIIFCKVIDALSIPLFLIFLILKLCGVIAWSWVLVCLPLIVFGVFILLTVILSVITQIVTVNQ